LSYKGANISVTNDSLTLASNTINPNIIKPIITIEWRWHLPFSAKSATLKMLKLSLNHTLILGRYEIGIYY
jgi:hypothetical protein